MHFEHILLPTRLLVLMRVQYSTTTAHTTVFLKMIGRDSSVGTATRYGLDGPGIEFWWGARFYAPVPTCPISHPVSYTMGTGSFPGG
jgi:hypothetical protein